VSGGYCYQAQYVWGGENPKKVKMGESFGWLKGMEVAQGDGGGPREWRWPKGMEVAQGDGMEGGGGGPRG